MRQRGTGSVYKTKNSAFYWVKYYRGGQPIRESSHERTCSKAERFLRQRLAEIATGTFQGLTCERARVDELAEDVFRDYRINGLKSIEDAEQRWNLHLKPFFGHLRAKQVGTDLLSRYVDLRQSEEAKNATINRELALLKRMFNLGHYASPCKVNRVPKFPYLQENNIRTGFLDDKQYEKLKGANSELWFRGLLEVGRTYGWRISELLTLKIEQLDFANKVIRLEPGTTKNKDGRTAPMTKAVEMLLLQCATSKEKGDHVFTRRDGKRVSDFRGTWKAACLVAGVPKLLFHDLRRTAARELRRSGVPEGVIMKIGGWRTRSVFDRYAIVDEGDIKEAMRKLEDFQNGHKNGQTEVEIPSVAPDQTIN